MSKPYVRKFNATNRGGIFIPHHLRKGARWRILREDASGRLVLEEVHLPLDSCPRVWLEEQYGVTLGDGALAELIR